VSGWDATVQAAIRSWIVTGSGLSTSKVIAAGGGGPTPEPPFITFDVEIAGIGQDWIGVEDNPDSTGSDGEEIIMYARGMRAVTIAITCHAATNAALTGAVGYLESVRSALTLQSVQDALETAELGIGEIGPTQSIGAVEAAQWEPRARMEARGWVASEISELNTYIETVQIADDIDPFT
jgi:hypothetical protein